MKYEVLRTCHTGGRMCRKGMIVEFKDEIVNEHLKPLSKNTVVPEKKTGETLKGLGKKPELTTGMAAKRKE